MAKKQQIPSDNIVNLGSLIELKLVDVLQDGRSEMPSLYVVEVRRKTDSSRPARSAGKCVLKTFPRDTKNQETFRHEVQAYSKLTGPVTYSSAQEAADGLVDTLSALKPKLGWPRCLGYLAVPTNIDDYGFAWTDVAEAAAAAAQGQTQNALLLEYIPGLAPVQLSDLDDALIRDILDVLAQLQEEGIHHRANVNPAVWPKPGIRNIYVRYGRPGGRGVPFISNFGNAMVLGDSERERRLMEAEREELEHHLKRGMQGKLLVDEVPREVQILLGGAV